SLPIPPQKAYRLGVQFPEVRDTILVTWLALPALPIGERVHMAWRQVNADEPIVNYSINFIHGPHVLGHGFNYYLVSGVLGAAGVWGMLCVARGRRFSVQAIVGIGLLAWVLADGQATNNLARQTEREMEELRGKSWPEQIDSMNGPEIAWAYSNLMKMVPPGGSFAVVSGDPFTPSRRLAYLLAPERIWRESYENADFVVVIRAGEAVFEERPGMFRWGANQWIRAEKTAEMSPAVYLLRRVPGSVSRPWSQPSTGPEEEPAAGRAGP
ncbi:MAG TPA: hypothetical protein VMV94_09095, partial [Phycisphaerae bacterium]|nr:hypothetical protein [Phycisphaerae bacterium]